MEESKDIAQEKKVITEATNPAAGGPATFKKMTDSMIGVSETAYQKYAHYLRRSDVREYSKQDVANIINYGTVEAQRKLSQDYFFSNGLYRSLVLYYATLLKYTGILIPNPKLGHNLSEKKIAKRYFEAEDILNKMNLPQVFPDIAVRVFRDGAYYGAIRTLDKDNFSYVDLPTNYCISRYKDSKGNYIVEFNLAFFDHISDETERANAFRGYPKLFKRAYDKWKKKDGAQWIFLPTDIGFCFNVFEDARPMLLSVIPTTIDYDDAVETEQERDAEEIKKIIVQKIPHIATTGELVFEPDEAEEMHRGAVKMMDANPNVSVLTTYADVDSIVSKTANDSSTNILEVMLEAVYSDSSVSGQLLGYQTGAQLEKAINTNIATVMLLARKFARFAENVINRIYSSSNLSFSYEILPISYQNDDDYLTKALQMANSGYSFLLPAAAMDLSPRNLRDIKDLENTLLELTDKLIPLQTSYTQSSTESDGEVGAPKKDVDDKSEKTIQNEESQG